MRYCSQESVGSSALVGTRRGAAQLPRGCVLLVCLHLLLVRREQERDRVREDGGRSSRTESPAGAEARLTLFRGSSLKSNRAAKGRRRASQKMDRSVHLLLRRLTDAVPPLARSREGRRPARCPSGHLAAAVRDALSREL